MSNKNYTEEEKRILFGIGITFYTVILIFCLFFTFIAIELILFIIYIIFSALV